MKKNSSKLLLAGVDEVGRGPLAGPVVAAAVILGKPIDGLKDSKKLTDLKRRELAIQIKNEAIAFAYGRAEVEEINKLNVHFATLLAMARAIESLPVKPHEVLIDGKHSPQLSIPCKTIIDGDDLVAEISAASIIAKVKRDDEMIAMEELYPGYGFASHKGYSTAEHKKALQKLGPCILHRRNFSAVSSFYVPAEY